MKRTLWTYFRERPFRFFPILIDFLATQLFLYGFCWYASSLEKRVRQDCQGDQIRTLLTLTRFGYWRGRQQNRHMIQAKKNNRKLTRWFRWNLQGWALVTIFAQDRLFKTGQVPTLPRYMGN